MAVDIQWLGHACFVIKGKDTIVIDPFLTGNPAATKGPEEIKCDIVAVTHGHGDHFGDAIAIAKANDAVFIGIYELATYAAQHGVEKTEAMNIGGTITVGSSSFTMVQAWHSSGMASAEFGFDGGTAAGYVIDTGKVIYHAGDTGLFSDMKMIAELYHPEIACLPIGSRFTMGPREAAVATGWLDLYSVIPMHYNTFDFIAQEPQDFVRMVGERCDTTVVVLNPGEHATFE